MADGAVSCELPTLSLGLLFVGPSLAEFHGREHTPSCSVKGGTPRMRWGEIDARRENINTQEAVPGGTQR